MYFIEIFVNYLKIKSKNLWKNWNDYEQQLLI
jgi:hypothetical protein